MTSHAPRVGRGQNKGLRDFCHISTLLPPGASVFHKHMSSYLLYLMLISSNLIGHNFECHTAMSQAVKFVVEMGHTVL